MVSRNSLIENATLETNKNLQDLNFVVYQPDPTNQILLYDMATSSSVLTYLKMKNIPFSIKNHPNSEFMSENGRLPVVFESGKDKPMCGFKEVFWYISRLSQYSPSILELSYMDYIETRFIEAEMYICWCYDNVLYDYTKNRYTYDLPWPISSILFRQKRDQIQTTVRKRFKDIKDFSEKFNSFLTWLGKVIGNRPFCPNEPSASAINALIYGHASAILTTDLHPVMVDAVKWHKRLENFVRMSEQHYHS